jgi:hypothetical protein
VAYLQIIKLNLTKEMFTDWLGQRCLVAHCLTAASLWLQTNSYAEGIPKNLANGLYELVEDSQISPALQRSLVRKPTAGERVSKFALKDTQGRIMVDIHLDGTSAIAAVALRSLRSFVAILFEYRKRMG